MNVRSPWLWISVLLLALGIATMALDPHGPGVVGGAVLIVTTAMRAWQGDWLRQKPVAPSPDRGAG